MYCLLDKIWKASICHHQRADQQFFSHGMFIFLHFFSLSLSLFLSFLVNTYMSRLPPDTCEQTGWKRDFLSKGYFCRNNVEKKLHPHASKHMYAIFALEFFFILPATAARQTLHWIENNWRNELNEEIKLTKKDMPSAAASKHGFLKEKTVRQAFRSLAFPFTFSRFSSISPPPPPPLPSQAYVE
jgi:hypothetical protein